MYIPIRSITKEQLDSWFTPKKVADPVYECDACGDTGVVTAMEAVYPGEPHMAEVGSQACPNCNSRDVDHDSEE